MKLALITALVIFSSLSGHAQRANGPNQRIQNPIPRDLQLMYTKGLKYLASSQQNDGSWKGDSYSAFPGTVALALLAFLAHGDDPNHGPYAKNIERSIDYLLSKQQRNGYIGSNVKNDTRGNMYNHGFATLALAEAYGMVDDDRLGPALENAVKLILSAQKRNPLGAWRYSPIDTDADSTVAGCQIVALFAARNAGIPVPDEAFKKSLKYMETCRSKTTGAYGYTNPSGGRATLTAIGVLCNALAKKTDSEGFKKSHQFLLNNLSYRDPTYPFYFEYYMSQALFHADEEVWKEWNKKNIKYLKTLQQGDGSMNGTKGKTLSTAFSLLSVALNYRFLPIYER